MTNQKDCSEVQDALTFVESAVQHLKQESQLSVGIKRISDGLVLQFSNKMIKVTLESISEGQPLHS